MEFDLQFSEITADNADAFLSLGRKAFGGQFSANPEEYLNWKYFSGPTGPARVLVARNGSDIAGASSIIPINMLLKGRTISAAISFDTMVSPEYQGQGLFLKIAGALHSALIDGGFKLIYGFPNSQSMHGFVNRLGWCKVNAFPEYLIPTASRFGIPSKQIKKRLLHTLTGPVGTAFIGFSRLSALITRGVKIVQLMQYDDRLQNVWDGCDKMQWPLALVRDGGLLKWRFFDNPCSNYHTFLALSSTDRPIGYAVFRIVSGDNFKTAQLMDYNSIESCKHHMRGIILKAYLELHYSEKTNGLMVSLPKGTGSNESWHFLFRPFNGLSAYLSNSSKRLGPILCMKSLDQKLLTDECHRSDFWHITPADMDWF